jgi:hypothetical protein
MPPAVRLKKQRQRLKRLAVRLRRLHGQPRNRPEALRKVYGNRFVASVCGAR